MAATDAPEQHAAPEPRWGIADAAVGWLVALLVANILGSLILAAFGYTGRRATSDRLPITMIALSYPPLWLGFVGVPIFVAWKKGNGWIRDFRVRFAWPDLGIGVAAGVLSQLVLVPLVSKPFQLLFNKTNAELTHPAKVLADKAHGAHLGAFLLVLVVVIGAPLAEELFFRGLVYRCVERRLGPMWAIGISAVVFGLTHFEGIQTPALIAFGAVLGYLVYRTDRLGTSVFTHMAFNGVSMIALLSSR
ncbi:MAG TPA: type II CAAX endopeptidase family protein [Acidimicrobiales bacterium]